MIKMLKLFTFLRRVETKPTRYLVRTISATIIRNAEATPPGKSKETEEQYQTIFRFPHIRYFVVINRLKVYQTILAGLAIPVTTTLSYFNVMDFNTAISTCAIGFAACFPLYGLSYFCKDVVGFIYTNEDGTKIKIAYLDFWGKRADIIVDSVDIVPFSEQPLSFTDAVYVNLSRYSCKDKLKINLRLGKILDNERFTQIFSKPVYH